MSNNYKIYVKQNVLIKINKMENSNEKDLTPQGGENQPEGGQQPKPKRKKLPLWARLAWLALLALAAAFLFFVAIIALPKGDKETEKQKTEQTDPAPPVVTIEVEKVDREHNWKDFDTNTQDNMVSNLTTQPNLKGEKVVLVYRIVDYYGTTMYAVQTKEKNGDLRIIFTEEKNVMVKN